MANVDHIGICKLCIIGSMMAMCPGGGGLKEFEIAASADDDDVVENCTRKSAQDEDFDNKARKAFNHAGGDGWEDNMKGLTNSHYVICIQYCASKKLTSLQYTCHGHFLIKIPIASLPLPCKCDGKF